jgi:hypothetical protein
MFLTRLNTDITQQLLTVTVPISIHDASNDVEIQKLEVATFPLSEDREEESNSSSETAPFTIVAKTRYGHATGKRMVHLIHAQEPLSNGVMWWQLKLIMQRIL